MSNQNIIIASNGLSTVVMVDGKVYGDHIVKVEFIHDNTGILERAELRVMPFHYHATGTSDHWFDRAKEAHGQQWIDLVKREVGKG